MTLVFRARLKTGFNPTFVLTNQPLSMAFGLITGVEHGLRTHTDPQASVPVLVTEGRSKDYIRKCV